MQHNKNYISIKLFYLKSFFALFLLLPSVGLSQDQQRHKEEGRDAIQNEDFRNAVVHLEQFTKKDSSDVNVLWMLGYSYFQLENHRRAIQVFNRLISVSPSDVNAFYFKGKAQARLADKYAWNAGEIKDRLMRDAIESFTKAVEAEPGEAKYLLERGMAHMNYGIFKSQRFEQTYNKKHAVKHLKLSLTDFEEVQNLQPSRTDIAPLVKKTKSYLEDF